MSVIAVVTAEGGVVNIHTFGAIYEGILMLRVFLICSEHLAKMLGVFLVYKAKIQDGSLQVVGKG